MSDHIEALLVEHTDDGKRLDPPRLLVNDQLLKGEVHPNGVLFLIPLSEDDAS